MERTTTMKNASSPKSVSTVGDWGTLLQIAPRRPKITHASLKKTSLGRAEQGGIRDVNKEAIGETFVSFGNFCK